MSTLLSLALLLAAPSSAGEVESSPPADTHEIGQDTPAEGPRPQPEPPPDEPGAQPEPPPPSLDGPAPLVPPPPVTPAEDAQLAPSGTTPPGEAATPTVPAGPEPAPSEAEFAYAERNLADMPYGATAARKSATQRNNDVLVRPFRKPVYSIAASGRFGTLLSGGADVVQPFGYGFAAQLRIHFVGVVKSRFGVEVHAGHARFSQRRDFESVDGGATVTRITLLTDTDFSAGPSFQIPLGPLFVQLGGSAGVALSTLFRPLAADGVDDEAISTSNFMLRGGFSLGVPVLNRHGVTLGAGVHRIFSSREVAIDPRSPESPTTRPFGTWLEVLLGYQIWF
ncbi:hypothetical protein [Enhygromyxa salina]|uniref:hypothetical protein n=1 Tax=Enhygromyxa salina TaxID=215803 RepID=UPI0011B27EDD|nr:hypothetical protein [Enhygromyxa salina]